MSSLGSQQYLEEKQNPKVEKSKSWFSAFRTFSSRTDLAGGVERGRFSIERPVFVTPPAILAHFEPKTYFLFRVSAKSQLQIFPEICTGIRISCSTNQCRARPISDVIN